MKFAKCKYAIFDHTDLLVKENQFFLVTDKIAEARWFRDGINTKNFEYIEVTTLPQLKAAVNVTENIVAEFMDAMEEQKKAELALVEAQAEPEAPAEVTPAEETTDVTEAVAEEVEKAGETLEPAFTEVAGNVEKAKKAIAKETNKDKLNYALEHDERKSVKKAINDRLKELVGE